MVRNKLSILVMITFCTSCLSSRTATKQKKISVPVGSFLTKEELVKSPDKASSEKVSSVPNNPCIPFQRRIDKLPFFVSELDVVINKVLAPCFDNANNPGYLPSTAWTAMGFPCTGGRGVLDWRGNPSAPQLLLFQISNSCPMKPAAGAKLEDAVRDRLGLDSMARMVAYYPFSVFFWELQDGSDADTSFTVEVVTQSKGKNRWQDYQSGVGIPVRMYGKPNAFLPMREWYEVLVNIKKETASTFYIEIEGVRILDDDDIEHAKNRCLDLRPRRKCEEIFQ